jgi:predicted glycoside hydrolase/deacetylase ChbG (UPF0249 family)
MAIERYLIVNADDFGMSSGVNRGIIKVHKYGIVTSTSLMVRWPAAAEAAAYSRKCPDLSLGLHVDLGEWVFRNGTWIPLYEVVPVDNKTDVADEVNRQLASFRRLVGKDPTHLDSHQHVHREEPVGSVLAEIAHRLAVPLRHNTQEVHYCGDFYGQTGQGLSLPDTVSVDALIGILAALPPGVTELGCHPGEGSDLDTMYRNERAEEVRVLCDPQVRAAIISKKIKLCSFRLFRRWYNEST